ncbi:MAG: hypothetical protein KAQ83_01160 [Nanoarchaeota archaeon]|nr:hypothetical protein [Nanoarchaeota archaeon]
MRYPLFYSSATMFTATMPETDTGCGGACILTVTSPEVEDSVGPSTPSC